MKPEKSEIIGLLCSEGCHIDCIQKRLQFDKRRGKAYPKTEHRNVIEFSNTNTKLLKRFRRLVKNVYGVLPNVICIKCNNPKITLARKYIVRNLLLYSDYGSTKWKVPKQIINSNRKVKAAFLRGLFDGDGNFSNGGARFYSCNLPAIRKVSDILEDLGINHTRQGPFRAKGRKDMYSLYVLKSDCETFMNLVRPIRYMPS